MLKVCAEREGGISVWSPCSTAQFSDLVVGGDAGPQSPVLLPFPEGRKLHDFVPPALEASIYRITGAFNIGSLSFF